MSKPLELTVYPLRWTSGRCTAPGRISTEPIDVDYWVACKRFTDAELSAEWHRSAAVTGIHGPHAEGNRTATIHRFATLPNAADKDYQ